MGSEGSVLGELLVKFLADTTGLVAGFGKATEESEKVAKKMEGHLNSIGDNIKELNKKLIEFAALIGITVGTEAFIEFVKGGFEATDQMAKLSDKLNINIDTLYGLKVAAADAGVNFESLTGSIQKMELKIGDAAKQSVELQKGFRELQIDAKGLKDLKPDEAFGKVADALSKITNTADRNHIAMEIFGKSYSEILNIIKGGSAGIEEATKRAQELGITISRVDAKKVEEAMDAFELLKTAVQGAASNLAVELSGALEGVANYMLDVIKDAGGMKVVMHGMVTSAVTDIAALIDMWQDMKIGWQGAKLAFLEVMYGIDVAVKAVITAFVYFGTVIGTTFRMILAEGRSMGAGFAVIWAGIKVAGAYAIGELGIAFSELLQSMAENGRRVLGNDVADAMEAGAGKMRVTFAGMEGQAKMNFEKVKEAAVLASDEAELAWTKLLNPTSQLSDSGKEAIQSMDDKIDTLSFNIDTTKQKLSDLMMQPKAGAAFQNLVQDWNKAADEIAKKKIGQEDKGNKADENEGKSAYMDGLKERLKDYQQYATEAEKQEDQRYQQELDRAKEVNDAGLTSAQENARILEGIKQDHEERVTNIEAAAVIDRKGRFTKEAQDRVSQMGAMFGNLASLTQSGNATLVAIGKAARVAQIIMDTAAAAMASFNFGAQIGGPVLGAVFAGAAIAAGAVQLATVNGTSMGGGGSVSGGASGAAAVPTSSGATSPVTQAPGGNTTNVKLSLGSEDGLLPISAVRALWVQLKSVAQDSSGQFNLMDSST